MASSPNSTSPAQTGVGITPIEYTRGTGPYFPGGQTTAASQTGLQAAVQSVNGLSSSALKIGAGPSSGATVNVTQSGDDTIDIGVSVTPAPATCVVGTAYPASPQDGLMCFRTDLGHLFIYVAATSTWTQVV